MVPILMPVYIIYQLVINNLLIQWTHPADSNGTWASFPIAFTELLYLSIVGNFKSTQSGVATYNDLSQYTGYIDGSILTTTQYWYRCKSNANCLFIGI